jgi:hypothetical protein
MRTKVLAIVLPPSLYKRLERDGRAEDRDAVQQARWVLRRYLEDQKSQPDPRDAEAVA